MPVHPAVLGLAVAALAVTGWSGPQPTPPPSLSATAPSAAALSATTGSPTAEWPMPGGTVLRGFDAPATYAPGHRGVDLSGTPGRPVLSALPGHVAVAGRIAGRWVVVVEHAGGLRTTYLPVRPTVEPGEQVGRGEAVGTLLPSTHCGFTSCLHWGARIGSAYVDPLGLVDHPVGRVVLLPDDPAG